MMDVTENSWWNFKDKTKQQDYTPGLFWNAVHIIPGP